MKKKGLYAVIILWIIVTGNYLAGNGSTRTVSLGMAFEDGMEHEWQELNTYIEAYGKFGVCYLTEQEKEDLVWNIAKAIGLTSPCHVSTEYSTGDKYGSGGAGSTGISTTTLTKDSINGTVTIKSITEEKRRDDGTIIAVQYVYMKITIYNDVICANDYRELAEGVFEAMGIDGNVNVNLVGSIKGSLNQEQKNAVADSLLNSLEAEVVAENRESDMFTIYAYSEGIEPYITIGGNNINVNIAISYDEEKEMTNVYLASPVNSLDY